MKGWSALLGALGFVALLFAVIAVLLLVLGGGAASDLPWLWGNLIVGLVLLGVAFATSLDELRARARSGEARRVGKYGTSAIAGTLLGIAILGLLGFLAERNTVRFDWTESGVHSLSDQSQKVLAGLDKDVEVTALYSAVEQPAIRPLLERYGYASPRFKVTWADPTARPDLVESLGAEREKLAGGLLHVKLGAESTFIDDVDEERLTNALVKLTRTAVKRVYFVEGHNERPASGETAAEEGGFARIADALRNENYQVETLVLGTVPDVPEDADVVVIGGATRPFLPQEHEALQRYLARGGALLVMIDPMAKTDLYADLKSWGVKLGEDYVIDQVQGLFGRAATPVADRYGDHDITRDLREVTLFHLVRSVRAEEAAKDQFAEIVLTGESSWAETSLDPRPAFGQGDTKGPVPIAVAGTPKLDGVAPPPVSAEGEQPAVEDEKKTPRLVVFGDSDFVTNELIDAYRNRDLFLNAVNWLLGDVQAISIRPNQARASRFQLTSEQFQSLRALSLFVLPQLLAALGAFAWWSRRRAPGR